MKLLREYVTESVHRGRHQTQWQKVDTALVDLDDATVR